MTAAIWWIRRDLRLTDNPALEAALQSAQTVVPLFIIDPVLLQTPNASPRRLAFLYQNLHALHSRLVDIGGRLIIRAGKPIEVLTAVLRETQAEAVFAAADYSRYALSRDSEIAQTLPLKLVGGPALFPPDAVRKPDGTPYKTFTPYSKAWKALPFSGDPQPAPTRMVVPSHMMSLTLPDPDPDYASLEFPPGEMEAGRRLEGFVYGQGAAVYGYGEGRNMLAEAGTSRLSPYLRFGVVSARQAVYAAKQAAARAETEPERLAAETWLNELIWREFFISILYHFPHVQTSSFQPNMQNMRWQNERDQFAAWGAGRTGYPVVDAAMRQLTQTGWMHNRARMITASFLSKHLLIDWRWGERFFMQHLIDGDPAANNGGWQWTAGTGVDAAPYFRIFNPITQGIKFDPQGAYIRRYLPELRHVPTDYIHQPWTMPEFTQRQVGCLIGKDYPQPIIEHAAARERALFEYNTRTK